MRGRGNDHPPGLVSGKVTIEGSHRKLMENPEEPINEVVIKNGETPEKTDENADSGERVSSKTIPPPKRHPKRFIAYRRIVVGAVAVFIPVILLFGKPVPDTALYVGLPLKIVGSLFILAGLWVRFYATCWISGYKNRTLLTDGPYAHIRHPLYFGNTLAALGVGLVSCSPWVLGIAALVLGPVFFGTALNEEYKLTDWFGEEYELYMKRTPRFIPRGWSFRFPDYRPMPWGIIREAFTAFGYIAIAALVTFLNWLKTTGPLHDSGTFRGIFHVFNG